MRQTIAALRRRFPGFYRHDFMRRQLEDLGWSEREAARRAGVHYFTAQQVLAGKATGKTAYPVCVAMGMDWTVLHDLTLPATEYRRAVLNGHSGDHR